MAMGLSTVVSIEDGEVPAFDFSAALLFFSAEPFTLSKQDWKQPMVATQRLLVGNVEDLINYGLQVFPKFPSGLENLSPRKHSSVA